MAITHDGIQDSDYTSQLAPGGLFTHPTDISAVDITTIQGHLNDAVGAAGAAKGWAVGDDQAPILTGYSETNNSMYYSGQASTSATSARGDADSASQSSIAATQSANAASASASSAQGFASAAETQASQAETSATAAANSATQAGNSATAALGSANEATNAAGEAATSATRAEENAVETDSDRRAVDTELQEIRNLRVEIENERIEIERLQSQIDTDSEQIAINLTRSEEILIATSSDSEDSYIFSQRARAFAEGAGGESGGGYSFLDTEAGVRVLGNADTNSFVRYQLQDHVNLNFPFVAGVGAPYRNEVIVGAEIVQVINGIESHTIEVYQNYQSIGVVSFANFASLSNFLGTVDYSLLPVSYTGWITPPAEGDIIHVFVTPNTTNSRGENKIADYRSALFQARRAEYFADHSLRLEERVDSEASIVDTEFRRIDELISGIHGRITDAFDVGYGLDIENVSATDTDIVVDTDIIASRRYVDSEIAALVDNAPAMYRTLRLIGDVLDSDSDLIRNLINYMDSDRIAREQLATNLMNDVDSDASAIKAVGARIDSEQAALRADIDSDAEAIRLLQRVFTRDTDGLVPRSGTQDSSGDRRYLADDGTWQLVQSGANIIPSDHVSISFNPTHQLEDQTPAVVTGTFSVNAPYQFEGTGTLNNGASGTDTLTITDTTGTGVTFTHNLDSDTFTFTPPTGEDGNIRVTATATVSNGTTYSNVAVTANFEISPVLFETTNGTNSLTITPSNDPGNFFATGIRYVSPRTFTYTKGGNQYLLIALPSEHSYTFRSGVVNLDVTEQNEDTTNGVQVYSIDDYEYLSSGETLSITITTV